MEDPVPESVDSSLTAVLAVGEQLRLVPPKFGNILTSTGCSFNIIYFTKILINILDFCVYQCLYFSFVAFPKCL